MKPFKVRGLSPFMLCALSWLSLLTAAHAENAALEDSKPLLYDIYPGVAGGDFWQQTQDGAADAAKAYGYRLISRGAGELDLDNQRKIFNDALAAKAKGILIAPNTPDRVQDVEKAAALRVPVVYFDRNLGASKIVSFIGTDNYKAGELAGQQLIKHFGTGHPIAVAVFRMNKEIQTTSDRERAFIDTVQKAGYKIVADPYITSDIGEGRNRIMKLMADKTAPKFEAIFTPNEPTTEATILTLRLLKKSADYIHIGFDGGEVIEGAIRNGELEGTVVQQPYRMGYYGVRALDASLKGGKVTPFVESGALYVNKQNIETYSAQTKKID